MQLRNRPTPTVALQQIAAVEHDMNNNTPQGQTDRTNAPTGIKQAAQHGQADDNAMGGDRKQDGKQRQQEQQVQQDAKPVGPQKSGQEQKSEPGRDSRR
ncbi:hypothetical protein ACEU0C_001458 [Stenotrophomonas indicatrix]|nr:hypothetical protein [Stenotrophomonas sp. HMWF023]QGL65097.1 hypothetical protein FEO87_18300 [Stenotrophomonas maltophilia]